MSSTDMYRSGKHFKLKNKEISRIIRKKSRKGSERWYQHVQHKRSSNSYNGLYPRYRYCYHRNKSIITPRLSQKNPIIQDCIRYYKDYHVIKNDNTFKHHQNNIPAWTCKRCTYNNIERKSYCNVCHFEYSTSKSMVTVNSEHISMDINSNISTEFSLTQFMKHEDTDKIYNQSLNGSEMFSNSKTKRNRKRRKKSRHKKLKKILDKSEDENWFRNVILRKKKKKTKKNKENIYVVHEERMTGIKTNNISIIVKMSLKPIVKYQYIAPKLMMTRNINYHQKWSSSYYSLIKGQNWTETYSVDNPMKLKNFQLLEIHIIVKDIMKNKQIKSFVLSPNTEKRLCFPIYLCEHSWVDLSLIPMNNKMFQIAASCMKQCIPDMLVNNIEFEYDSIHDPNYNLLPICDDMSRILIEYMPSMDIIHNILLEYIGYKEIGYVYMNVKNVLFRKWAVQFSKNKIEDQIIDVDYDKYQYVYSPTDELYIDKDNQNLDEQYDTESSSLATGNLFGGDDTSTSSSDEDSSSDDDYRYTIIPMNRNPCTRSIAIRRRDRKGYSGGPSYSTPCKIYKFDNYCVPERKAKITKYPLKYMKVRSPNRYLQRKWSAYYKLRNDYVEH